MEKEAIISELKRTINIEGKSIMALENDIDMDVLVNVVEALADCKGKIILSGCGTSAMAAKKIAHSLCCIDCSAIFLIPSDAVHGALGVLHKNDIFILISKGGNTSELINMIPSCKTKGALLIGVSENEESVIAKESDIYLKIKIEKEPCKFNMLATASTLAVISAFDAVCIVLMQMTGYTREKFAIIHPGGAVGSRLLGKEK